MEGKKLLTIIIPVYNVEAYLPACLDSVINQTYNDLEIVVVDDGSTDGSGKICDAYAEHDTRIRVIHQSNSGVSAARNKGINDARGEYIYFLDGDDVLSIDCIELLARPLERKQYDFVIGQAIVEGTDREYPVLEMKDGEVIGNAAIVHHYTHGDFYMMVWNKLIKSEFIKSNKLFFKEGVYGGEDDVWSLEVVLAAESMYAVNAAHYHYKINEGSYTNRVRGKRRVLDILPAIKWINIYSMQACQYYYDDIMYYLSWMYRCYYLEALNDGGIDEYIVLRRKDPRTKRDIIRLCSGTKKLFRTNGHLLFPPRIGYALYSFILKNMK